MSDAEETKDDRTPCVRDGHKFEQAHGDFNEWLFCTKCGHFERLPLNQKPPVGFRRLEDAIPPPPSCVRIPETISI